MNNCYVYSHVRHDKNEVFYIGIGANSRNNKYYRAYQSGKRRNKIWNDIVSKTTYSVNIIIDNLTWSDACNKEKELISLYGRIDNATGILSNMTDGGDGGFGCARSEETRKKMSIAHKGRKKSEETRRRMSMANIGRPVSEETRRKISQSSIGISSGGKHPMAKKVIDIYTGRIYECAKFAANDVGIKYRTLHAMLTGQNKNRTNLRWL